MAAATCSSPAARATSMPRWMLWIQDEQLNGTTTPVVPRMESPPMMPSRALSVFFAIASPPGNRDRDDRVGAGPALGGKLGDRLGDHRPRHRIDRRLAHRQREPGPGDRADPFAGTKEDAGTGIGPLDPGAHEAAMGHIGIIAGILDDPGRGPAFVPCCLGHRQGRLAAARQPHGHRRRRRHAEQEAPCDLGCRGGTGAGRPAAAQHLGSRACVAPNSGIVCRGHEPRLA